MNYPYQRYSPEYIQAVEQDLQKYVAKTVLSNVIINSVHPIDRRQVEAICDGVSGVLDLINPPKTIEGQALAFGTNAYNLSKYL